MNYKYDPIMCMNVPVENKTKVEDAIKIVDVGRGYDQIKREANGLMNTAKEITTKLNRLYANSKELEKSIRSDSSIKPNEAKELMDIISKALNYIGNHTEV